MLPDEAEKLLTELWLRLLTSDAPEPSRRELADFTRPVCEIARAAGLLPEELIVAVKRSWGSRHELRRPGQRRRLEEVLADVVTACIDEFYRVEPRAALEPARRDAPRRR